MQFVPRKSWAARPVNKRTAITNPVGVTVHWEGVASGTLIHSRCPGLVRGIQRFHIDTRHWADIAYNAVVCPHGVVFEGRGVGVQSAANGNPADNSRWYAVCALIGPGDAVTPEILQGLDDAIVWMRTKGDAGNAVNGHRDHKATQCPGDDLYGWVHRSPHPVVRWTAPPVIPQPIHTKDKTMVVLKYGSSVFRLVRENGGAVPITEGLYTQLVADGVPNAALSSTDGTELDEALAHSVVGD